ncbi:hypothetical protein J4465_02025 [Candidatus Pacearchaeota archaeon]|nr:hypothetical protein [Candidatus Pacearchaeota archaeon]
MKTQKKSKGFAIFAIAAIVLLAIGFAVGVSDNTKLLTASVVSGISVSDIQTKLSQFSETMAKNEALLNDLESQDSENQDLEAQILKLKQDNEELKDAAFGLFAALNVQPIEPIESVSTSSSHSSHSSNDNICAPRDCYKGRFNSETCKCESIPNERTLEK